MKKWFKKLKKYISVIKVTKNRWNNEKMINFYAVECT